MTNRNICTFVLAGLVFAAVCLAQAPATAPATQPTGSAVALMKIRGLMGNPKAATKAEYIEKVRKNRGKVFAALAEMESKYPKAKELHEARLHGVMAAIQLGRLTNDPKMGRKAKDIVATIITSDAPMQMKLNADAYVVLLELRPIRKPTTKPAPPINGEKIVLDFTERYAKTDVAVDALMVGRSLAEMSHMDSVVTKLEDTVLKKHPEHPVAKQILQRRKTSKVGKPFAATLTKLDGTKLTLPDDLLGKVVVIDFWAVWCKPCIATIPHMKALYAKYKSQGVEFVGISLDQDKKRLEAFVATNKMGWIHAFSGKAWSDPTARKYGIRGIPSIWVVGKDGKVVSDNARGRLPAIIEKALAATIVKPAG
jgi:thiol-disulfide isomerase/thioredoxin